MLDGRHRQVPAVGAGVHAVAGVPAGQDVVAGAGLRSRGQMLVGVQRHHPERSVGHRHVEILAVAGALTAQQGGHDGQRGVHAARGDVGHRGAGQGGSTAGVSAAAMHIARHGQIVEVVARPVPARAGLAVAAGGAVDDAPVDGPQRLVVDAETVDHAGPEALHHHVGPAGQVEEGAPPAVGLQVEPGPPHTPVAAVGVGGRHGGRSGQPRHRTDLHHARAVVGQQSGGPGCGSHRGQVEHPHAAKSMRAGSRRHFYRCLVEDLMIGRPSARPSRSSWGVRGPGGR